jgi:hypothetical protein
MAEFPHSSGIKEIVPRLRLNIAGSVDEPHIAGTNGDYAMRVMLCLMGAMLISKALPAQAAPVDQEARLAKRLEGRVAGKPVDCIPQYRVDSTEIFDRTGILYKAGSTWYLNRPVSGLNFLHRDDVMLTDTHSTDLCSVDIVRLLDQGSHFPVGTLGLGKFVPYRKP